MEAQYGGKNCRTRKLGVLAWVLTACIVLTLAEAASQDLKIGAFNVQIFGQAKADKPEVMKILVKVRWWEES